MRHSIVLGSLAAILLIGVVSAVVVHRAAPTKDARTPPHTAALKQEDPIPGKGMPAEPSPAAQPPRPISPSFDVVKVGPTGTAVIAGRAEPGSKVTVRDGDKVIGEVTADARGEWVLVPDQPIGPGDRLLSLEAANGQGKEVTKSDETVALSISPPAPGKQGETALAVVLPREGAGGARVLQRPDARASDKSTALSMDAVEYDAQGGMALSGHAQPGATVQIYLGDTPIAKVIADAAGAWSATSMRVPGSGRLELRLDQLDQDGRVAQRVALPLAQAAAVQLGPGQSYVVQPGNSLWQIARRAYGNGVRYLIIYSANLEQIRNPQRIYPGQVFKLPKS